MFFNPPTIFMLIPTSTNNQPRQPRYCHLIHRIEAVVIRFLCCNGTSLDRLIMDIAPRSLGGHGGDGTSLVGFFIALSFGNGLRHRGNILQPEWRWLVVLVLVGWLVGGWVGGLVGWLAVFLMYLFQYNIEQQRMFPKLVDKSCWNLHAMKKRRKTTKVTTIFGGFQHHHLCSMTPNIHPPFKGWPVANAQVVRIHDAKSRRFWSQIFGSWNHNLLNDMMPNLWRDNLVEQQSI